MASSADPADTQQQAKRRGSAPSALAIHTAVMQQAHSSTLGEANSFQKQDLASALPISPDQPLQRQRRFFAHRSVLDAWADMLQEADEEEEKEERGLMDLNLDPNPNPADASAPIPIPSAAGRPSFPPSNTPPAPPSAGSPHNAFRGSSGGGSSGDGSSFVCLGLGFGNGDQRGRGDSDSITSSATDAETVHAPPRSAPTSFAASRMGPEVFLLLQLDSQFRGRRVRALPRSLLATYRLVTRSSKQQGGGHGQPGVRLPALASRDPSTVPTEAEAMHLKRLEREDPLYDLQPEDSVVLYRCREFNASSPPLLPKFLRGVFWSSPEAVLEAHRMLFEWSRGRPVDAIELLDIRFSDPVVREYAVNRLDALNDDHLKDILLQLVQVLKYEPYHDSALMRFLLRRALLAPLVVGHPLFWMMHSEMHIPVVQVRYSPYPNPNPNPHPNRCVYRSCRSALGCC